MDRLFAAVAIAASLWLCLPCCWVTWLVPLATGSLAAQIALQTKTLNKPFTPEKSQNSEKKPVYVNTHATSGCVAIFFLGVYSYKSMVEEGGNPKGEQRYGVAATVILLAVWCGLLAESARARGRAVVLYKTIAMPLAPLAAVAAAIASGLISGITNPEAAEPRDNVPYLWFPAMHVVVFYAGAQTTKRVYDTKKN